MLRDKLGRQFKEGQKAIFHHPGGTIECDVEAVEEIMIARGGKPPMKTLVMNAKIRFNVPPECVDIPDVYIVKEAEEKPRLVQ